MAAEVLALLGGAVGILLIAMLPLILFLVALWRIGTGLKESAKAHVTLSRAMERMAFAHYGDETIPTVGQSLKRVADQMSERRGPT